MKKTVICLIGILSALSLESSFAEKSIRAEDLLLTIKPIGVTSLRRGVKLDVNIEYTGEQTIDIFQLREPLVGITFEAPPEWNAKSIRPVVLTTGVSRPPVTLKKSESVGVTTFLNHYISSIKPGEVVVSAKLQFHLPVSTGTQKVTLETQVALNIIDESDISLRKHVDELAQQLKEEKDLEKRILLYRQLLFISSDNVADILLRGLQEKRISFLKHNLRQKIVELSGKYGHQQEIVKYLLTEGGYYDGGLFVHGDNRVNFSAKEWKQLRNAKSIWVRLHAINHRPISINYSEQDKLKDIAHTESILSQMSEFCKEIREKTISEPVK